MLCLSWDVSTSVFIFLSAQEIVSCLKMPLIFSTHSLVFETVLACQDQSAFAFTYFQVSTYEYMD